MIVSGLPTAKIMAHSKLQGWEDNTISVPCYVFENQYACIILGQQDIMLVAFLMLLDDHLNFRCCHSPPAGYSSVL